MKIPQTLRLCYRIIKLEQKLLIKFKQGADLLTLEKDLDLLFVLIGRLKITIGTLLDEQKRKKGTTVARKRA